MIAMIPAAGPLFTGNAASSLSWSGILDMWVSCWNRPLKRKEENNVRKKLVWKGRRAFYGVAGSAATRNDMGASRKIEEDEEKEEEEDNEEEAS